MEDIGLFKQGWKWLHSRRQAFVGALVAASRARDKLAFFADRHWPMVRSCCVSAGGFLLMALLQWRDCVVRGFWSLISVGSVALFVILWCYFISFTSTYGLVCMLLSLGSAGAAIRGLGYTPGLFIVGLFGILIMWIYGNVWISGILLTVGGSMFLNHAHARIFILISSAYAVYCVNARVGWLGVFLSLNLSFLSNDFLNKLLQGYDGANRSVHFEEHKESEPFVEDFCGETEYYAPNEAENVASHKSCETPTTSNLLNTQKDASSSKVVEIDTTSIDEINRIVSSSNHYEALGFPRNKNIDPAILKRVYRTKAKLVHPDKNMGSPLASESFKKLKSAYEVLSNLTKKKIYDEQLRKDEFGRVSQKSRGLSQQEGVDYRAEESRRIECTKCGNLHIWICTSRSKIRARWCQDCSQYHQAKDGDGWVERGCSFVFSTPQKVEIPRAFVCAESKIFDVSEWAICQCMLQGMVCSPNTHRPSFRVKMVGLDKTLHRSNPSRFSWGLDAEIVPEDDERDLWLQRASESGLFSESPRRRKIWSPFKMHQKGMKPSRRSL